MRKPVELGKRYRDTISGFEGTATSRHEYLFGCVRVCLEGGDAKDPKELTFDEQRLEHATTGERPRPTATSGGDRPPPARTGMRHA